MLTATDQPERGGTNGRKPAVAGLRRTIGGGQLLLYGLGSMVGTGIYGLIGKAAGTIGGAVWMAFVVAMVAALLTGISYASIASRYPKAGGAAYVTQRAFHRPWLSYVVGLTVLCSGLASIATQAKVVAENVGMLASQEFGYLVIGSAGNLLIAAVFLLLVAGVVYRGISTSVWVNAVFTAVSAAGLLLVVTVGMRFWGQVDLFQAPVTKANPAGDIGLVLLLQGSILTFFSFLGFEDMLNVAEEVERPQRNMPIGIIGSMVVASVLYIAVAVTVVSVVPWGELASAPSPLMLVIDRAAPWFPAAGFTIITIAAVSNTALVNYVMGSRLLYGMARQGLIPDALSKVHGRRRTPHVAIGVLLIVVVAMQFLGDISQLASATVLLLLLVFVLVNAALIALKLREGDVPGCFDPPVVVPMLGVAVCAAMIAGRVINADWQAPALTVALIAGILMLYALTRPSTKATDSAFSDRSLTPGGSEQPPVLKVL